MSAVHKLTESVFEKTLSFIKMSEKFLFLAGWGKINKEQRSWQLNVERWVLASYNDAILNFCFQAIRN